MNKLSEMEVFVGVVEAGSLAQAARALRRDPSSISKMLTALEDRLGVDLVTRTTRSMALTEAGEEFYGSCKTILMDVAEAEEAATVRDSEPRGLLRVVGMNAITPTVILPLVDGFLRRCPHVRVDLIRKEVFPDLVDTNMDVALRIGEIRAKGLECVELAPSRRIVAAAPSYIAAHGAPSTLADLAEHNCIGFSTLPRLNKWGLTPGDAQEHIRPTGNLSASSADLIRQAALSGMGVCMLSDLIVRADIEQGRLVPLFPDQMNAMVNNVCAIYPRRRRTPVKTLAFVEFLKEALSSR